MKNFLKYSSTSNVLDSVFVPAATKIFTFSQIYLYDMPSLDQNKLIEIGR